ncbi:hypothetical protein [Pedobacter nototheniae]|uniref:hypothetical protein n=1 Tax=Pedobacter nototheniae TaxID=2488994 RepID=UPI00103BA118|nr:hypothetical protein [Pedobacter nototheniae]
MLQINLELILNDKDQIKLLLDTIKKYRIDNPVYIVELEECVSISVDSDYEQYELIKEFADHFEDYELVKDIESSREEILLIIKRNQSAFSTDGWGRRWNEDDIKSNSYLVKKRERKPSKAPNSTFWVLFGEEIQEYKTYVVPGHIPETNQQGYLVVRDDPKENPDTEILSSLLKTKTEGFWAAYQLKLPQIEKDYEDFKKQSKRKSKKNTKTGKGNEEDN